MAIKIEQQPKPDLQMAGQQLIWAVSHDQILLNENNVKFICNVHMSRTLIGAAPSSSNLVATLKTSPNSAGSGIFDLQRVADAYVSPTYEGGSVSVDDALYKSKAQGIAYAQKAPHSIHNIDFFATNNHNTCYLWPTFDIEYLDNSTGYIEIDKTETTYGEIKMVWNAVLQDTNPLGYSEDSNGAFTMGFYLQNKQYHDGSGDYIIRGVGGKGSEIGGRFLSNMPEVQSIHPNDFGTVAFFNCLTIGIDEDCQTMPSNAPDFNIEGIRREFFDSAGNSLLNEFYANVKTSGGAKTHSTSWDSSNNIVYFGHGLGNFQQRGGTIPANAAYYEVCAAQDTGDRPECVSRTYRFNIIKNDCKGFERIRLAWLNRLGTWDYFTFTKRNTRTVKTKQKYYHQLSGTWNERVYLPKDHLGGKKVYKNDSRETLTLNTDYMTEEEGKWLEELFTSPQVFILNPYDANNKHTGGQPYTYIHRFVEPCVISSKSFKRKSMANDGPTKMMYKLQIEKSQPKNIQQS